MDRLHCLISGRVQGVFYRASAEAVGRRLGVTGWVQNLPDGRVEALAEGPRTELEQFLAWCHEGPPDARVTGIEASWSKATGEFRGFEQRRH